MVPPEPPHRLASTANPDIDDHLGTGYIASEPHAPVRLRSEGVKERRLFHVPRSRCGRLACLLCRSPDRHLGEPQWSAGTARINPARTDAPGHGRRPGGQGCAADGEPPVAPGLVRGGCAARCHAVARRAGRLSPSAQPRQPAPRSPPAGAGGNHGGQEQEVCGKGDQDRRGGDPAVSRQSKPSGAVRSPRARSARCSASHPSRTRPTLLPAPTP